MINKEREALMITQEIYSWAGKLNKSEIEQLLKTSVLLDYDKGEAMNTVIACLQDFMKDNQYYHYTYLARDREKYFKNDRGYSMAQYMSYVKMTR